MCKKWLCAQDYQCKRDVGTRKCKLCIYRSIGLATKRMFGPFPSTGATHRPHISWFVSKKSFICCSWHQAWWWMLCFNVLHGIPGLLGRKMLKVKGHLAALHAVSVFGGSWIRRQGQQLNVFLISANVLLLQAGSNHPIVELKPTIFGKIGENRSSSPSISPWPQIHLLAAGAAFDSLAAPTTWATWPWMPWESPGNNGTCRYCLFLFFQTWCCIS